MQNALALMRRKVGDLIVRAPVDGQLTSLDAEIGQLMQQTRDDMAARTGQPANINLQPPMFEEHARRRVALGLILATQTQRC